MATQAPVKSGRYPVVEHGRGYGWVLFAGTMLALVGLMNVIYGIGAISSSKFFVQDAKYVISDLNTWGWFMTVVGAAQICGAYAIWTGLRWGRWIGIATASVNGVIQLLAIPSYPWLALALFTIDVLVLYALAVHGRQAAF